MIAREGIMFILVGFVGTGLFLILAVRFSNIFLLIMAAIFGLLSVFTTYFFRDPDRQITAKVGQFLSPADGKIIQILPLDNHPHIGGPAIRVSIFLSAFDVHINRVPNSGVIDYVRHVPGRYMLAWKEKASEDNERSEIGMTTDSGDKIAFRQIAGTVARRIVCYLNPGDTVIAGNRFGLIRFGSRMDIIVPTSAKLSVKIGDRVKAGLSVIGSFGNPPHTDSVVTISEESNAD